MKDLLHPISLVVATLGFLCLLRDVPTRRRDPASTALAAVFLLSGLSFLFSITPMWNYLDRVLATVNLSVPLAQGCVVALLACQQVVLTYWGSPPDVARRMESPVARGQLRGDRRTVGAVRPADAQCAASDRLHAVLRARRLVRRVPHPVRHGLHHRRAVPRPRLLAPGPPQHPRVRPLRPAHRRPRGHRHPRIQRGPHRQRDRWRLRHLPRRLGGLRLDLRRCRRHAHAHRLARAHHQRPGPERPVPDQGVPQLLRPAPPVAGVLQRSARDRAADRPRRPGPEASLPPHLDPALPPSSRDPGRPVRDPPIPRRRCPRGQRSPPPGPRTPRPGAVCRRHGRPDPRRNRREGRRRPPSARPAHRIRRLRTPDQAKPMDDIDALLDVARHLPRQPARAPHLERVSA